MREFTALRSALDVRTGRMRQRVRELSIRRARDFFQVLLSDSPRGDLARRSTTLIAPVARFATMRLPKSSRDISPRAGLMSAASAPTHRRATLTIEEVRIVDGLDLTARLSGTPAMLRRVTTLALEADAGEWTGVPIDLHHADRFLLVVARLPPAVFARDGVHRVRFLCGSEPLRLTITRREAVRLGGARPGQSAWPLRVAVGWGRGLTISGRAPADRGTPHSLDVGEGRLRLRWADTGARRPAARFQLRDGGASLTFPAEPADDGWSVADIDVQRLAHSFEDWDVQVRGDNGKWQSCGYDIATFPALHRLTPIRRYYVSGDYRDLMVARYYTTTNSLVIRARPRRRGGTW